MSKDASTEVKTETKVVDSINAESATATNTEDTQEVTTVVDKDLPTDPDEIKKQLAARVKKYAVNKTIDTVSQTIYTHSKSDNPEDAEQINLFFRETLDVGKTITTGFKDAWNSAEPEFDPEFNPKSITKLLIIPSILIILYYVLPVDVISDAIPVVGTIDDFGVAYLIFFSYFQSQYKKITGNNITISEIMSGRMVIHNLIEHIVTSTIQLCTIFFGDIVILPTICTVIDCITTLVTFHRAVYKKWPNFLGKVKGYNQDKKARNKKKKDLLNGGALK